MNFKIPWYTLLRKTITRGLRKCLILLRHYCFRANKQSKSGIVMFFDDKYCLHYPGLVDRLKAIVGVYAYAKDHNINFHLIHNSSFLMERYLEPNRVLWNISEEHLERSIFKAHFFDYLPYARKTHRLKNNLQYHCYFFHGSNFSSELKSHEEWRSHFFELFRVSDYLKNLINNQNLPEKYVSVHFRFVNSLGSFEKNPNSILPEIVQNSLIEKCLYLLSVISKNESEPIIVFSDSDKFLLAASNNGYSILGIDNIGHISFCRNNDTFDKAFLDLFIMSNSSKVISVRGDKLYNSAFSQYAAVIGDTKYDTYDLDQ